MATQLLEKEKKSRENEKERLIVEKEVRKTYYESLVGFA